MAAAVSSAAPTGSDEDVLETFICKNCDCNSHHHRLITLQQYIASHFYLSCWQILVQSGCAFLLLGEGVCVHRTIMVPGPVGDCKVVLYFYQTQQTINTTSKSLEDDETFRIL